MKAKSHRYAPEAAFLVRLSACLRTVIDDMYYRLLHSAVETEVIEFDTTELAVDWIAEKNYDWPDCTLIEFEEDDRAIGRIYNGFELREMHDGTPIPSTDSQQ